MAVRYLHRAERQQGTTLVELIIAIVVLGIAAVGILTALGQTTAQAVDPLLRAQSLAIAQSFMDEVTSRPFYDSTEDPAIDDTITNPDVCPNAGSTPTAPRNLLTHACAYDGYSETGITTPDDDPIVGLEGYQIAVAVSNQNITGLPFEEDVAEDCILRIRVTATDPAGNDLILTSYRTSYWEECA